MEKPRNHVYLQDMRNNLYFALIFFKYIYFTEDNENSEKI